MDHCNIKLGQDWDFNKRKYVEKKKFRKNQMCPSITYKEDTKKVNIYKIYKTSNSKLAKNYVAANSLFKSDKEIIANLIKDNTLTVGEPVRDIDPATIKIDNKLSKTSKAAILCKKYRNCHPILYRMAKKPFVTDKMADLIFTLIQQVKESER